MEIRKNNQKVDNILITATQSILEF